MNQDQYYIRVKLNDEIERKSCISITNAEIYATSLISKNDNPFPIDIFDIMLEDYEMENESYIYVTGLLSNGCKLRAPLLKNGFLVDKNVILLSIGMCLLGALALLPSIISLLKPKFLFK